MLMTNDDNDDHDKRKKETYQMYKSYNMYITNIYKYGWKVKVYYTDKSIPLFHVCVIVFNLIFTFCG